MARWVIATVAFLAIGWLGFRYGHLTALATLLLLIVLVAVFGGHGPRGRSGPDDDPPPPSHDH